MKKLLLSTLSFGLLVSTAMAQNLETVYIGTTTVMSGETHVENIENNDQIYLDLSVFNRTASAMDLQVERVYVNVSNDWSDQVCWGVGANGNCYPVSTDPTWTSPDVFTVNPDESATLTAYINPNTASAPSHYRYYFGTVQNPHMDSVDVMVNSVAGVIQVGKNIEVQLSPNPASDYLTVKANNTNNARLKVVDVLGNVIVNDSFVGSKTLNVRQFKNGVYFVIIEQNGTMAANRKIVVRH